MFQLPYRYLFMLLLAGYSFLNIQLTESLIHYPIPTAQWAIFLLFVAIIWAIWDGNRLIDRWLSRKTPMPFWRRVAEQFAGSIALTTVAGLALGSLTSYWTVSHNWVDWGLGLKLFMTFCFRINLFLNTLHVIFLYKDQLEGAQKEALIYKKISMDAQLQALQNQVNPHFLFNNLSVLSALIPSNADASVEFVKQFSKVYRYVLKSPSKDIVPLSEELNFIQSYLYLLKTRFSDSLQVHVDVPLHLYQYHVVPVTLQMLVENAIKHNVASQRHPLVIEIFAADDNALVIRNNLQHKVVNEENSTQLGLNNIARRYDFLSKKHIRIEKNEKDFTVTLPLLQVIQN
jgi:two-component system, LytTR family, sensor kinase